jgi:hypothetical protein
MHQKLSSEENVATLAVGGKRVLNVADDHSQTRGQRRHERVPRARASNTHILFLKGFELVLHRGISFSH